MKRKKSLSFNSAAFTLIELIVAFGIIALLAGLVIAVLDPLEQFKKADDTRRKSDLAQIQRVLESYYQDHGRYPDYNTSTYIIVDGSVSVPWGSSWSPYISVLPRDPVPNLYRYVYRVDRSTYQTYWIYAHLDRGDSDPQACNANGAACDNAPSSNACGGICNYGVSSPNTSP